MTKKGLIVIRIIAWLYVSFLGIVYAFYREDFPAITTDNSAILFFAVGLFLILYDFGYKKEK